MCLASFLTTHGASTLKEASSAVPPAPAAEHVTSLLGKVAPFTSMKPIQFDKFTSASVPSKIPAVNCLPIGNSQPSASGLKATIEPSANEYAKYVSIPA